MCVDLLQFQTFTKLMMHLYELKSHDAYRFLRDHLKPVVKTEEQFLYVCHLVGPFLQRLHSERTRSLMEVSHIRFKVVARGAFTFRIQSFNSLINFLLWADNLRKFFLIAVYLYCIK